MRGRYPQVARNGHPLRAVNAALRAKVLSDERSLISGGCPAGRHGPGPAYYVTNPSRALISASSVVVSALMFGGGTPPGANFSSDWAAVTVRVADAQRINIGDLFRTPYQGLSAVAATARARLMTRYPCVRSSPNPSGFAPKRSNYRYFALTTRGLAVGFTAGVIAPQVCGYHLVIVPYARLQPFFGKLGRALIAGVRAPAP